MSIQSRQNDVARIQRELATIRKQDADEAKKEVNLARSADQTERSLNRTSSDSIARSYRQKLVRLADDMAKIQAKRAGHAKKLADKISKLHQAEQSLTQEQDRERTKLQNAEKRREREQLDHQRKLSRELGRQKVSSTITSYSPLTSRPLPKEHDAFISHASEDKTDFVRPLAEALQEAGFDIWYDELSLTVGDSLRQKIDNGLSRSRFGIVVLSSAFFSRNWPQYELNGLVAKEMEGRKVILPIWHKVSKDEVMKFSPSLADKVAINTSISSLSEIVEQLAEVLRQ